MGEVKTIELFLVVDDNGDAVVAFDTAEDATASYNEDYCGAALRTVKINVTLTLPVPIEVNVNVPDEAGQTATAEVSHG